MTKVRLFWALKLSLLLILFSFLLMNCSRERMLSVFIENQTADNFRIGGPNGPHIKVGEVRFLTTLTETENSYSVELWRSYGCITGINITGRYIENATPLSRATAIIYEPPILPGSDSSLITLSVKDCS